MGYINSEDQVLIKIWWVGKKMNVMDKMFKDEKKKGNCQKQFTFVMEVVHIFKVLEFTAT